MKDLLQAHMDVGAGKTDTEVLERLFRCRFILNHASCDWSWASYLPQ
jgi:hypothetical protein